MASVKADAVEAELQDADAIRKLVTAITQQNADKAHKRARDLLDRSIPHG